MGIQIGLMDFNTKLEANLKALTSDLEKKFDNVAVERQKSADELEKREKEYLAKEKERQFILEQKYAAKRKER